MGDPGYYHRFGFRPYPKFGVKGCPPDVVLALPFQGTADPFGDLTHHPAFGQDQQG